MRWDKDGSNMCFVDEQSIRITTNADKAGDVGGPVSATSRPPLLLLDQRGTGHLPPCRRVGREGDQEAIGMVGKSSARGTFLHLEYLLDHAFVLAILHDEGKIALNKSRNFHPRFLVLIGHSSRLSNSSFFRSSALRLQLTSLLLRVPICPSSGYGSSLSNKTRSRAIKI